MDSVKVFLRLYWLQTCMQLLSASEALLMDSCSKVSIASRYLNTECPSAWYMLLLCLRTEQKYEFCPKIGKITHRGSSSARASSNWLLKNRWTECCASRIVASRLRSSGSLPPGQNKKYYMLIWDFKSLPRRLDAICNWFH